MTHPVSHTRQRLRPWLSDQIDSGNYPSLEWLDKEKMIFKIPWKHFGKPGVNDDDAKIFREWARHTGKYKDGDPPDPSTWKTRFRCALYKLPDIQEMPHLNMLDGDEPYRVYRFKTKEEVEADNEIKNQPMYSPGPSVGSPASEIEDQALRDFNPLVKEEMLDEFWTNADLTKDLGSEFGIANPELFFKDISDTVLESQEHVTATTAAAVTTNDTGNAKSNSCTGSPLKIQLYYRSKLVEEKQVTNSTGCRIAFKPPPPLPEGVANEESAEVVSHIFGPFQADQVYFPDTDDLQTIALLQYMKRGLVLQTYQYDVYATRLCQAKIFYSSSDTFGGVAAPQELTRENTTKVFDYQNTFLPRLNSHLQGQGPPPSCELYFSFGQRWNASNPLRENMVHVCVTHILAKKYMANVLAAESSNNVLLSAPNALDMIASQIENINLETGTNGNSNFGMN